VLAQDVDELQPDRVTERLRNLRHPRGSVAIDIRVNDGLTTALPRGALRLRNELQIDTHQYMSID
jgi:hypothetical protein